MEGAQAMTFDEWWKDKTAATGELRDFGRKRKAYEVCWLAAQAQCAAGPWQDIKDAPKDGSLVLLINQNEPRAEPNVARWQLDNEDDEAGWYDPWVGRVNDDWPTHFAPLRDGGVR